MRVSYQSDEKEWNNQQLIAGLREGDENAFTAIYKRYWSPVFMVAYRKTKSKEIAEELVQNLFVNLWNRREILQITQLENYLFTSIKNAVLRYYESQLVHQKYLEYQMHLPTPYEYRTEETISLNELDSALQNGLAKLPEKSQEIFRMSRFENKSISEIASRFDISEKAVEYHITKSLRTLRHLLKDFASLLIFTAIDWLP
jgi:RNA polymerase sigma-70 factor (ECF subfamily)